MPQALRSTVRVGRGRLCCVTIGPVVVGTDLGGSAGEAVRQAAQWAARIGRRSSSCTSLRTTCTGCLETPKVADALASARERPRCDHLSGRLRSRSKLGPRPGRSCTFPTNAARSWSSSGRRALPPWSAPCSAARPRKSSATHRVRYSLRGRRRTTGSSSQPPDFSEAAEHAVTFAAKEAKRRGVELRLVHSLYEAGSSLSLLGPMLISGPETPADRDERAARRRQPTR